MSDTRVYVMTDTMEGKPAGWTACVDWGGSPRFDASGQSPAEAFARLAEVLADHLREWEPS